MADHFQTFTRFFWDTITSLYMENWYLKVASYFKEYNLGEISISCHSSLPRFSKYHRIHVTQRKFSGTRTFTLRYQQFVFDFKISRADCISNRFFLWPEHQISQKKRHSQARQNKHLVKISKKWKGIVSSQTYKWTDILMAITELQIRWGILRIIQR